MPFPRSRSQLYVKNWNQSMVVTDEGMSTGHRYFVDSVTGNAQGGYSPENPCLTLTQALVLCADNIGDIIYLMPCHVEAFGAATGFAVNKAGVKIIGLGNGDNRPSFYFTATDAACTVTSASVTIENVRFVANTSDIVVGLTVSAADFTMRNCLWWWGVTTGDNWILHVDLTSAALRATFENNQFFAEIGVAGAASAIRFNASHNLRMIGNDFEGDFSVAAVNGITAVAQHVMFLNNTVYNVDAAEPYLEVFAGTTGVIGRTRGVASGATIAANAVANAMAHCENYVCNTTGLTAIIKGAGGSPALDAD